MLDIGLTVALAIGALLVGFGLGYLALRARVGQRHRVAELETALEASQDEMKDYKREVFEQFGETADKFRALNRSYEDLHQQLAKSAVTLCGDSALPLLDAPRDADDSHDPFEASVVMDQTGEEDDQLAASTVPDEDALSDSEIADSEVADSEIEDSETTVSDATVSESMPELDEESIVVSEEIPRDAEALGSSPDDVPVPTLTEVQEIADAAEDLADQAKPTTAEDEVKRQA